jgi:hypothetical protein
MLLQCVRKLNIFGPEAGQSGPADQLSRGRRAALPGQAGRVQDSRRAE